MTNCLNAIGLDVEVEDVSEALAALALQGKLSREVLEGETVEADEVLAGLDAVTAEDLQRVAQDVIASNGVNLALIGPFEDAERFEALLT